MEIARRLVLQTQLKATGITETWNRRRQEELNIRILDIRSTVLIDLHQFVHTLVTFAPRLQVNHPHTVAGSFRFCHQTVTGQCRNTFNFIERKQSRLYLVQHLLATLYGSSRRCIHIYINHTLVFVRNESGRQYEIDAVSSQEEKHQSNISQRFPTQILMQSQMITTFETVVSAVEHHKELAQPGGFLLAFTSRLQQQGAQGRRQRQRIDTRDNDGYSQCQGELTIENTDRSLHEAYRHEYRRHDQRNGNNGTTDFFHGSHGCLVGRKFLFMHLHMHRFHHDNRIIDHNTDGQYQRKERQHIDGEAQHLHEEEGTDQRNRYGYGRNQRRTEILKEDIHDNEHQQEGFQQGLQHRFNGSIEETGNVVRNVIVHARRKTALLDFFHTLLDVLDNLAGIRTRPLLDHDGSRRTPVSHRNHVVVFRVEFNGSHILQPQQRTVRHGFQDNLPVFFGGTELTGILQYVLQLLRKLVGTDTRFSRSRLDVLPANSLGHILRNHVICGQTARIQPHTHRIVSATHDFHESHPVDTFQLTQDIDIGKVIHELLGMCTVGTEHIQVHQHTVHLFFGHYTGTDYLFGKLVEHCRHTVLHVDRRYIRVRSYLEINGGQ